MAALSIRDLDEQVKERLRVLAAQHGRSMEAEVRSILTEAVSRPEHVMGLGQALLSRFAGRHGVDLELPPRAAAPKAPELAP